MWEENAITIYNLFDQQKRSGKKWLKGFGGARMKNSNSYIWKVNFHSIIFTLRYGIFFKENSFIKSIINKSVFDKHLNKNVILFFFRCTILLNQQYCKIVIYKSWSLGLLWFQNIVAIFIKLFKITIKNLSKENFKMLHYFCFMWEYTFKLGITMK